MNNVPSKSKAIGLGVVGSPLLGEARVAAEAYLRALRWPPDVNSKTRYNPTEVEIMARLAYIDGFLDGIARGKKAKGGR